MIAAAGFGLGAATLGIAFLIGLCVAGMVELVDGCFARARSKPRAAPSVELDSRLASFPNCCTCEPQFFPDALDAACPQHGIAAFLREKFAVDEAHEGLS